MKILVLYHSMHGHIQKMAEAVVEGAKKIEGAEVTIKRVPETLSDEVLKKMGAFESVKEQDNIEVANPGELANYDAIIFGSGTRFGNMTAQMRSFLDATGSLWANNSLVGKVGSVFTSSATQHGGQESTILSFHTTLLHQGMIIVGLPYSFDGQKIMNEITGCSPYGASTITGGDGSRMPSDNELEGARFQGKYVAEITKKIVA